MINFNLSLKYYILPYGTNIGGLKPLLPIGKPVRLKDMTGLLAVGQLIHDKGQLAGQRIAMDKKTQDPMIEGIGFRIRAYGQTYRTVGSGASPVFITTLHLTLPLRRSPYLFLITAVNGL